MNTSLYWSPFDSCGYCTHLYIRYYHHLRPGLLHSTQTCLSIQVSYFETCSISNKELCLWFGVNYSIVTLPDTSYEGSNVEDQNRDRAFWPVFWLRSPRITGCLLGHCPGCNHTSKSHWARLCYNLKCDTRGLRVSGTFLVVEYLSLDQNCVVVLETLEHKICWQLE